MAVLVRKTTARVLGLLLLGAAILVWAIAGFQFSPCALLLVVAAAVVGLLFAGMTWSTPER